ncbi:Baseplate protein J-like domain-containing protein [Burkholderia cepacia]|uniref:hypothetical protein n=1 Tax=Burkholderia cepacia TaxID=292 RepID=UPI0039A686B8
MPDFMTVDITDDAITAAIIADLAHPNGKTILAAFTAEALRLDFRFSRRWYRAPAPDVAMHVIGHAVEAVDSGANGALLAKEIVDALEDARVYMHMGPSTAALLADEQQRYGMDDDIPRVDSLAATDVPERSSEAIAPATAPVTLTVDVVGDQVIISGDQQFSTFNWKAGSWGNEVKRLSVQTERRRVGLDTHLAYHVIAGDLHGSGSTSSVVAENLSDTDARDLIRRIQDGVKASLGIGAQPADIVELANVDQSVAGGASEPFLDRPSRAKFVESLLGAVIRVFWVVFCIVAVFGLAGGGVVAVPIAYRIGQHLSTAALQVLGLLP